MKYEWQEGMREISGFSMLKIKHPFNDEMMDGKGYEDTCRAMLKAGCEWLEKHPKAKLTFKEFENVTGFTSPENRSSKSLESCLVKAAKGDCTGAQMQAVVHHLMFIKKFGWGKYVETMKDLE
jgi:hypothetical protein